MVENRRPVLLGQALAGEPVSVDVALLVESRLLVQANSGGGKSWLLRRLLEQTHGMLQHVVIDPEGEFATLRERHDYVLASAGEGGDCPIEPRSAHLLARKLMEMHVSAVLDIYELKQHERIAFVERFLTALVNLPRKLWHPVLVVVDEAHVFCPEQGKATSGAAVVDLATRGRKRGMCAVLATQRLSKLRKDAAAELNNVLIGRTGLDIDMARAGDALGMSARNRSVLRQMNPGEFYAFGPALADGRGVRRVQIGSVDTTHPTTGQRLGAAPPPPPEHIRALLSELADLPDVADQEVKSLDGLRRENASLRVRLRRAEQRTGVDEADVARRVARAVEGVKAEASARMQSVPQLFETTRGRLTEVLDASLAEFLAAPSRPEDVPAPVAEPAAEPVEPVAEPRGSRLRLGERKILEALARRHPLRWTRQQVAMLTGYAFKGGTFTTYIGVLRRLVLIEEYDDGLGVTDEGYREAGSPEPLPTDPAVVLALWNGRLRLGERTMLSLIVEADAQGLTRAALAEQAGL